MKETQTNISYVQVPSYIVDKPTSALAEEIASSHKAKDLMYIKFELMHANVNRNKDEFTTDELKTNYKTAVAKPINWEHTNEIIGHIYESEYVPFEGVVASDVNINTDKVVCHGVVYKYRFPSRAAEISSRYDNNNLFFSMETYFNKVQCSECQEFFDSSPQYCEHLKNRYNGSNASRRLLDINICGAGCVKTPADDARALALASQIIPVNIVTLMDYLGPKFSIAEYIFYLDELRIHDNKC